MFCNNCGVQVRINSKFCPSCGQKLNFRSQDSINPPKTAALSISQAPTITDDMERKRLFGSIPEKNQSVPSASISHTQLNNDENLFSQVKRSAKKEMIGGLIACVVGIAITWGSYALASGGGTYFITWGPILFGAIAFFKGLFDWFNHKTVANNIKNKSR